MNSWIDLHALWKIVLLGLLAGAGLPAIFAVGLRALSLGTHDAPATAGGSGESVGQPGGSVKLATGSPVGLLAAAACFALVLAAIGYGIYLVVASS